MRYRRDRETCQAKEGGERAGRAHANNKHDVQGYGEAEVVIHLMIFRLG